MVHLGVDFYKHSKYMPTPYKLGGPLLPPVKTPKVKSPSASASVTRKSPQRLNCNRPCTASRTTCRRRKLRCLAAKQNRKKNNVNANNSYNITKGAIPDKHLYLEEVREGLQDLIDLLYAAGRDEEAKEKEELLAKLHY